MPAILIKNKKSLIALAILCLVAATAALVADPPARHAMPSDSSDVLPIGNQKYTLDQPLKGHVYLCGANFFPSGAHRTGEWIDEARGVWFPGRKPSVQGANFWKGATSLFTAEGAMRSIQVRGVPADHPTGDFPIKRTDPAFAYDRNPNPVREFPTTLQVPRNPVPSLVAACLPWGPIGYALSGVPFFHAIDTLGRDAPAYEIQDQCAGHPAPPGRYHYHTLADNECLGTTASDGKEAKLLGYSLDGFGIYSQYEDGQELQTDDLDECHGHAHVIEWDGVRTEMYHYHATRDYPYTLSCFKGIPAVRP